MPDIDAGLPPRQQEALADALPQAWLLVFEYDAGGVRLAGRKRIEMLAPSDDSALTKRARAGHWIELRDAKGRALYRQVISSPFQVTSAVHSPEPGAMPRRVPRVTIEGRFRVVVPDLADATEIVLFGLGTPAEQALGARSLAAASEAPRQASPLLSARLRED